MTATQAHLTDSDQVLYLALELSNNSWKLAFTTNHRAKPRLRNITARDQQLLLEEVAKAKKRFRLPKEAVVRSVYEAGRDGFWIDRFLQKHGIDNIIVDPGSIEVDRRMRRAKTDRLDATKLVSDLIRHHRGEKVWKVVHVPSEEEEAQRYLHRDMRVLKRDITMITNRLRSHLATVGITIKSVDEDFGKAVPKLRDWEGKALHPAFKQRLLREFARWQQLQKQLKELQGQRREQVRYSKNRMSSQVRHLLGLKGIGLQSAWMLAAELFSWRQIANRRALASLVGLTPMPYQSGGMNHNQGISKAGNGPLRALLIEISWCWLYWQPDSALSKWFKERFGSGGKRHRRVGIVALARKLLIAVWRFLERGEIPEGAELANWKTKLRG